LILLEEKKKKKKTLSNKTVSRPGLLSASLSLSLILSLCVRRACVRKQLPYGEPKCRFFSGKNIKKRARCSRFRATLFTTSS